MPDDLDPRAAERLRHAAPRPRPFEFDPWARDTLERALARGRLAWPKGPTTEQRHLARSGRCA